jgi:hypothetical protein
MRALALKTFTAPLAKTIATFHHLHPLAKVDLPPLVNDFHPNVNFILDKKHLFLLWHIHHIFYLVVLWVWCMNFCEIALSLRTLVVVLNFFFGDMWAHHSWSCSSIYIMFVCYIVTIGFG